MKRLSGAFALAFALSILAPQPAHSLEPVNVGSLISSLTRSASLSNPSVIFIDESNGQVVYERDSNSLRKPASLMKLYTAAAALTYLDPQQKSQEIEWRSSPRYSDCADCRSSDDWALEPCPFRTSKSHQIWS